MSQPRAITATMLVAALLPVGALLEAQERTIRCESSGNRQNFCRVNTDGRVTLSPPARHRFDMLFLNQVANSERHIKLTCKIRR